MFVFAVVATPLGAAWNDSHFVAERLDREMSFMALPVPNPPPHCAIFRRPEMRQDELREARDRLLRIAWSETLRHEARQSWESGPAADRLLQAVFGPSADRKRQAIARADRSYRLVHGNFDRTFRIC